MRTLALLAALLLLALQARAQVFQQTADQVPAQDQPEAQDKGQLWAEDQDPPDADDQDVVVSFTGQERLTRHALVGLTIGQKLVCRCRRKCRRTILSKLSERVSGVCKLFGRRRKFCCQ